MTSLGRVCERIIGNGMVDLMPTRMRNETSSMLTGCSYRPLGIVFIMLIVHLVVGIKFKKVISLNHRAVKSDDLNL